MTASPAPAGAGCVACGNTAVRRVATLCEADEWPTSAARRARGTAGLKHSWGKTPVPPVRGASGAMAGPPEASGALNSHQLLQALAPPAQPCPQPRHALHGAFLLAVAGLLCLPLTLWLRAYSGALANSVNIFFCGTALLLFLVGLAETKSAHKDYEAAVSRWQTSMRRWAELFYCDGCQRVYDPRDGRAVPVRNMSALL